MENQTIEFVEVQMLIRKPVTEVFEAFIDPSITRNFWFTKGSGKVEVGESITWQWEMYNISTQVVVKEILQNKKILIDWGEPATSVEFRFQTFDGSTYVIIKQYGFTQSGAELIAIIKDSTGGFTTVLDGLKAYLENGIKLNLIEDKFPKEVSSHAQ